MKDRVFNIVEAEMHFSRLLERVERGERIIIARNNRPVAILSPAYVSPEALLSRMRDLREAIRKRNHGRPVRRRGETWRDLINSNQR